MNGHSNLYLYFLCLALLKTRNNGLVALVLPYEWVARPSARAIRDYIREQRWSVDIYRFQNAVFADVLTTASICIVDKSASSAKWRYFDISEGHEIIPRSGMADSLSGVLGYAPRGRIWALRGLSPGSQPVFALTESERVRAGLTLRDVVPCVTTLRHVPDDLRVLSRPAFQKHFVRAGRRCWLVRSYSPRLSHTLRTYLESVPAKARQTYTCINQRPWFNYPPHPVPRILFGSGFTSFGPKVLLNAVGARAVGSVWGIHAKAMLPLRRLQEYLRGINFESRVIAHAKTLKKVEVRQLNGVLSAFGRRERRNGR
jgi:hypothetical protein